MQHYEKFCKLWELCRDCYLGTPEIKGLSLLYNNDMKTHRYLPPTPREVKDARENGKDYLYRFRQTHAVFENIFRPVIDEIVGIMQKNDPVIQFGIHSDEEVAEEVRRIEDYGTCSNDGLKGLKWRVNFNQALFGRYGMLLDIVTDRNGEHPQFCITEYEGFKILDGEEGEPRVNGYACLKWLMLDESKMEFNHDSKHWEMNQKIRILGIDGANNYYNAVIKGGVTSESWRNFNFKNPYESNPDEVIYPTFYGKTLDFIPFTVCNVNKLGLTHQQYPPFLDVAEMAISLYQVDSLYKKALWNNATPTLVLVNAEIPTDSNGRQTLYYLGDTIAVQSQTTNPADVKLLETQGAGLQEMRLAKDFMRKSLKYNSLRELLDGAGANSSGSAIQLRTVSGTSSVAAIDNAGALAIEEQLIYAAIWSGEATEDAADKIQYSANTTYLNAELELQSVVSLLNANVTTSDGRPLLSKENIFSILDKTMPDALSSYEDNEKNIDKEMKAIKEHQAEQQNLMLQQQANNTQPKEDEEQDAIQK